MIKNKIETILEDAKLAHKEAVIIDNEILQEKLLSIMVNTKLLSEKFSELEKNQKPLYSEMDKQKLEELEIKKVKRKVPAWLNKKSQNNYKILKCYMDLSNNGKHTVNIISLQKHVNIDDSKKFYGNYSIMKNILEKNHAKVFEEINGEVFLWTPVKKFLIELFDS